MPVAAALAVLLWLVVAWPGSAAAAVGDRAYCCWRIDVQADGEFMVVYSARDAPHGHEPGDVDGKSGFAWTAKSRGLYTYRELGRQREPQFDNLFARGRNARAAKELLRFRESGDWCEYGPIHETTDPAGDVGYWQSCDSPPSGRPCERIEARPWSDGSGVQIVGRRGARKLAVDVIGNVPATTCSLQNHRATSLLEHGMQGPAAYAFVPPRTTGAQLRARRTFDLTPPPFATTTDVLDEQPHGVQGTATVKVTFTYFPRRHLRRQRRALEALG